MSNVNRTVDITCESTGLTGTPDVVVGVTQIGNTVHVSIPESLNVGAAALITLTPAAGTDADLLARLAPASNPSNTTAIVVEAGDTAVGLVSVANGFVLTIGANAAGDAFTGGAGDGLSASTFSYRAAAVAGWDAQA